MKKKILAVFGCVFVLLACMIPAFAHGYENSDYPGGRITYYSAIPFSHIVASFEGTDHWIIPPLPGTYSRFSNNAAQTEFPTNPSASHELRIWSSEIEDYRYLNYTSGFNDNVTVMGADLMVWNDYEFLDNGVYDVSNFSLRLSARNFMISKADLSRFISNSPLIVKDSCTVSCSISITFNAKCADGQVRNYTISSSKSINASADQRVSIFNPLSSFAGWPTTLDGNSLFIAVDSLQIDLGFSDLRGGFSLGSLMLRDPRRMQVILDDFKTIKTETIEVPVYIDRPVEVPVPVPMEKLDMFSWIVRPVESFFELEFYPGISVGGIFTLILAAAAIFAIFKLLS